MSGELWAGYAAIAGSVIVVALLNMTDGFVFYRESFHERDVRRRKSAITALLAPVWPIVVVLVVIAGIPYGIYRLARIALGKEQS